jgi:hypothetical protein
VYCEPARALRNEAAREQHQCAECRSDAEADAPADVDREDARVEQDERCGRPGDRTQPEAAVDDEIAAYSPPMPNPVIQRKTHRL